MRKAISLLVLCCTVFSAYAWKPIFAGHRGGYKGVANTAEAYRNGVDVYGYAGLECDVRVTSDGEYVIMHDETTNSLGGSLTVATSTLAQLKAETLTQTRSGVTYTGTICTIAEYLDICVEKNAFPLIELKWTTGINNNDMSKFPGLLALVEKKGLKDKVVFLTSMKKSIEYVRTNYPTVACQFLTGQAWSDHFDWCIQWQVNPSIQAGYFDLQTVKIFHDVGLQVAVWTVNTEANYTAYGNMGVYMMTCDYLKPAEMPELEEIAWDSIEVKSGKFVSPDKVLIDNVRTYPIKTWRTLGNVDFPYDAAAWNWAVADSTVCRIKNGVLSGLKSGTTYAVATLDESVDTLWVTVEAPETARLVWDDFADAAQRWDIKASLTSWNARFETTDGQTQLCWNYTVARQPYVRIEMDSCFYGLPDSISLHLNTNEMSLSKVGWSIAANAETQVVNFGAVPNQTDTVLTINTKDFEIEQFPVSTQYISFYINASEVTAGTDYAITLHNIVAYYPYVALSVPQTTVAKPLHIFPNPASNYVYVRFDELSDADCCLSLYSLAGTCLCTQTGTCLNVSSFPAGMYLLRATDRRQSFTAPLIINRE